MQICSSGGENVSLTRLRVPRSRSELKTVHSFCPLNKSDFVHIDLLRHTVKDFEITWQLCSSDGYDMSRTRLRVTISKSMLQITNVHNLCSVNNWHALEDFEMTRKVYWLVEDYVWRTKFRNPRSRVKGQDHFWQISIIHVCSINVTIMSEFCKNKCTW